MAAYVPKHAARDAAALPVPAKSERRKLAPNAIAAAKTYVPAKPATEVGEVNPRTSEEEDIDPMTKKSFTYVPKSNGGLVRPAPTNINIDPDQPLLRKVGILPSGDPLNPRTQLSDANYDSSDYEHFLQAYRVAMTKVSMAKTATIEVKPIITTDEESLRRSSTSSFTRRSSNAHSVFEKIGNYIKPSRPESGYSTSSWMTSQTADTSPMASRRGSAMTQRWSNGSICKESKEVDRDAAAIEKAVLESWDGRRRSKVASSPISPVIKRFGSNTSVRP
ncbi:hypothetical protein BP6252_08409 [Coleophoma cylindrospora]|uniref:Uncharacterized protein n=1 Tax=Coleophoma cylindrospora TaxID=1849047 RepID=A0A3D8R5R8_9HELO|nr:hypothetical protein BP6252_08409 [Coleophoma cylindrospora]